jgi:hypothetical protein
MVSMGEPASSWEDEVEELLRSFLKIKCQQVMLIVVSTVLSTFSMGRAFVRHSAIADLVFP